MECPEVLARRRMLGKSHYAALHYQGVLFNFHVMCLSSYCSVGLVWFYCVILNDSWEQLECKITMTPFMTDTKGMTFPSSPSQVQTHYLAPNIPHLDTPSRSEASKPPSCIFSTESHTWLIRCWGKREQMCAQDEERTIWENSERHTGGWETEWVWGFKSQEQLLVISARWHRILLERQTRRGISLPLITEWVESPVWPPRVSASCNFIHGPQNTAERGSNRTKTHNDGSHLRKMVILSTKWVQLTCEKTFPGVLIGKLIPGFSPVNMECSGRSFLWDLIASSCHNSTSSGGFIALDLTVLACSSQHKKVKIHSSIPAEPCPSYSLIHYGYINGLLQECRNRTEVSFNCQHVLQAGTICETAHGLAGKLI